MPGNYRQTYRYDRGNNLLEQTHVGPQNHGHRLVADRHSNRCLPVRNGIEPTEQDFRDSFDANGNLRVLHPGQTLSWDLRNQLREVRPVERDGGPSDSEQYVYGADGQRVRKTRSLQTHAQSLLLETLYLPGLEIRTHSGTGEILHVIDVSTGRGSVRVLHWQAGKPDGIANRIWSKKFIRCIS
jgi:insecticidal toxin complex protein TccC